MKCLEIEKLNEYKDSEISFLIVPLALIISVTSYIITRSNCSNYIKLTATVISIISLFIYTYENFKDTKYFNLKVLFKANIISLFIFSLHLIIWSFLYDCLSRNYIIAYFNSHSWLGIVIYSAAVISFIVAPIIFVSIVFSIQQDIKSKIIAKLNIKYDISISALNKEIKNITSDIYSKELNTCKRDITNNKVLYFDLNEKIDKIQEFNEDFTTIMSNTLKEDIDLAINSIDRLNSNNIIKDTILPSILENYKSNLFEISNYINNRYSYINNQFKSAVIGREGENLVNQHINMHHNIINLYDVNLKFNSKQIQCDNILITKKGIFVLEVKNYGTNSNYSLFIDKDGRWLKKTRDNFSKLSNATEQNNRHVAILDDAINSTLGNTLDDFIEAKNIVVIANDTINICNNSNNQIVLRPSEIYPYLQSIDKTVFTEDQINKIKNIILSNMVKAPKYPMYDVFSELDDTIVNIRLYVDNISKSLALCSNLINNRK